MRHNQGTMLQLKVEVEVRTNWDLIADIGLSGSHFHHCSKVPRWFQSLLQVNYLSLTEIYKSKVHYMYPLAAAALFMGVASCTLSKVGSISL